MQSFTEQRVARYVFVPQNNEHTTRNNINIPGKRYRCIRQSVKLKYLDRELLIDPRCKMTHFEPLAVGAIYVTARLTTLPYNSFKSYCSNTKLNLILIYL